MRSFKARYSPTLITNWWDEENVQSANFIIKILQKAVMDRSLSFTRGFFRSIPLIESVMFYLVNTDRVETKNCMNHFLSKKLFLHLFIYIALFSTNTFLSVMPSFACDTAKLT